MLAPPGSSEGAKSLHHPLSNGVEVVFGENVKRVGERISASFPGLLQLSHCLRQPRTRGSSGTFEEADGAGQTHHNMRVYFHSSEM